MLSDEDAPTFMSTSKRKQFGYDAKTPELKYNLIRRYLKSKVGMHWNDVWADICYRNAPKDKKDLYKLIKEEVNNYIYFNCFEEDGAIYTFDRRTKRRMDKGVNYQWSGIRDQFYVYNGTLYCTLWEKQDTVTEQKTIVFDGAEYFKHYDIWYRVVLKSFGLPRCWDDLSGYDSLRRKFFGPSDGYRFYGRAVYCSAHYPLNNKELKALKNHLSAK